MMASRIRPRSVTDATRFTSTVPHATSKTASSSSSSKPITVSKVSGETPEQRVRRLRLAHLAAQKVQISQTDRFIDASRGFFDAAHRWTIRGIVFFTAVAGIVSVYSVWDMLRYNRARRAEWIEAQKKLEADALLVARVAYLKGEATEEQIALVEEANQEAEAKGFKLPPLLSPPEHRTHFEERVQPFFQAGDNGDGKGVLGMLSGLFGGSTNSPSSRSSSGSDKTGAPETRPASKRASGGMMQSMETLAKDAWETEKANQLKGGTLDKLGLEATSLNQTSPTKKRGWWPL